MSDAWGAVRAHLVVWGAVVAVVCAWAIGAAVMDAGRYSDMTLWSAITSAAGLTILVGVPAVVAVVVLAGIDMGLLLALRRTSLGRRARALIPACVVALVAWVAMSAYALVFMLGPVAGHVLIAGGIAAALGAAAGVSHWRFSRRAA